ncbi:hypothetical protein BO94DRAFT_574168 [Aspergillus sclerotioniger CBS 115572]|uniref:Uncharacterized protein n=1 Tax=Aspergillus sclerotioniger CBS 115572 TaxID=1450535 RepID=A0A317WVG0_9EURO|nr:hypothetical protein BO94DRAFT_574168 [Aspergillus sclerotioniger CBS 115572]PWY90404.1 hypothetical protein BO94DRAFT_574168 [Aspergillus sclerotioniger CBS 115572]
MSEPHSTPGFPDINRLRIATAATPTPVRTFKYEGLSKYTALVYRYLHSDVKILKFLRVSADEFSILSLEESGPLKSARLSYNSFTEILHVRMPSNRHESLNGLFRSLIDRQLFSMSIANEVSCQSSPSVEIRNWTKEPDSCWLPENKDDPFVVLEVGASETTTHLATSARRWIDTPGSTVLACISIKVRPDNDLVIDVWKRGKGTHDLTSGNVDAPAIRRQHIEITNSTPGPQVHGWKLEENWRVVSTDEILLEFSSFVGRPADNDGEHDILLDRSLLIGLATRFFDRQA